MKAAIRDRILQAIEDREDRILAFLQSLVRIDSHTGNEGEAQDLIARMLRDMDLELDIFEPDLKTIKKHPAFYPIPGLSFTGRPNVIGIYKGDPQARSLILNGHVDTIPVDANAGWQIPPLSGILKDGELYGCGSSDMKSGLASMIMALHILMESGLPPRGRVIIESVVDEELTGYGTLSCVLRGYRADAGICTETSDLQIMPACIGRLWFTIEIKGKSAGIATRWLAENAIEKGMKIVHAVDDLERMRIADLTHPLYPDNRMALPCLVTMFNAGSFPSATPEIAVLRGSLGLMPYEDVEGVKRQFCRQIELISMSDPWLRSHPPVITFKDVGADGAEIPIDHPIVETLSEAFRESTKRDPTIAGRTGGADSRYLIKYGKTPTVIFGPGVTAKMHMVNESVPLTNVLEATKTLALAIHNWCQ
jgi:acetylornithine deacetylase